MTCHLEQTSEPVFFLGAELHRSSLMGPLHRSATMAERLGYHDAGAPRLRLITYSVAAWPLQTSCWVPTEGPRPPPHRCRLHRRSILPWFPPQSVGIVLRGN